MDTSAYIRKSRIIYASSLLKDSDVAIGDIEIKCGFESPSYFSKVFREYFGISPTLYRRNILKSK